MENDKMRYLSAPFEGNRKYHLRASGNGKASWKTRRTHNARK